MSRRFGIPFVTKHGQRRQRKQSDVDIPPIMFGCHSAGKATLPYAVFYNRVEIDTLFMYVRAWVSSSYIPRLGQIIDSRFIHDLDIFQTDRFLIRMI